MQAYPRVQDLQRIRGEFREKGCLITSSSYPSFLAGPVPLKESALFL
jgi:hypothetical protein